MDLTVPLNVLMWVTGLVAIALSLNSIWAVLRVKYAGPLDGWFASRTARMEAMSLSVQQRTETLRDIHEVVVRLRSMDAAMNDIGKIERDLRRSKLASSVEIAAALAALVKLREVDETAKVVVTQIEDLLTRQQ